MGGFIVLLVFLCIGAFALIGGILAMVFSESGSDARGGGGILAGVGLFLTLLTGIIIFVEAYEQVPARTVSVETKSGKPVSVLNNGGHMIAPWAKTQNFDATVQSLTVDQTVRLKNNTTAVVDVSVQWQIDPNTNFLALYNNYRTFDNVRDNVVKRQMAVALNEQFANFDPLGAIDKTTGASTVAVAEFAKPVEAQLIAAMPGGLVIRSVAIVRISYSAELEKNIDAIIAAAAQTRVAEQQELTNAAQAKANSALGTPSAGTYQQNCLNIIQTAMQKNYQLPAGFNCSGTAAGVVVSGK